MRSLIVIVLASLAAPASGVSIASASPSRALPLSPTYLSARHAHKGLQVRPPLIVYTGDGTGFLGGANAHSTRSRIRWQKWTARVATGSGFNQINDCKPYCAAGKFHRYPVRIEMWRPRTIARTPVFTRMTIFYRGPRPAGEPRHYTFTDDYVPGRYGGFGWGPPGEAGYCTHTHGVKPEADCKNIHSLP